MKFDKIIVEPCLHPPPKSAPCPDTPVQPDDAPLLILKPAVLCLAVDSSAVLKAFAFADGQEIEIHGGLTFMSSDPTVALVGGASGVVTGLKAGEVTISVEWSGMVAQSVVTVGGESVNVGMAAVVAGVLLLATSPILDPKRISAASQAERWKQPGSNPLLNRLMHMDMSQVPRVNVTRRLTFAAGHILAKPVPGWRPYR